MKPFKGVETNKWYKIELFVLEFLEPFNYVQTIVKFVYKQISFNSLKNKTTFKLLTNKSYV